MGTGCSGLIKKIPKWMEKRALQNGCFFIHLCHLLGPLLCNYPPAVYGLGYNEVYIRAYTFLQRAKELLLLNVFTLETAFYFTLHPSPPVWVRIIGPTTLGTY